MSTKSGALTVILFLVVASSWGVCPQTVTSLAYGPSEAVAVRGDLAAVSAGNVVVFAEVGEQGELSYLTELRLSDPVWELEWVGDVLAASTWPDIELIYRDATGAVRVLATIDVEDGRRQLAADASLLWVLGGRAGGGRFDAALEAIDLSVPVVPEFVGMYSFSGYVTDLAVVGDRAYLADSSFGLRILDLSDTYDIHELGSYAMDDVAVVAAAGDHAFVATNSPSLASFDLSNPAEPELLAEQPVELMGFPRDLELRGDQLLAGFAACDPHICPEEGGLVVYDVAQAVSPTVLSSLRFSDGVMDMAWHDDQIVVADRLRGMRVVDVSEAESPILAALLNPGFDEVYAVAVDGVLAYLGDRGVRVVDMAGDLEIIGRLELEEYALDLAYSDGLVGYLAADGQIKLVAVSDPEHPSVVGELARPGARALDMWSDFLAVAEGENGVQVFFLTDLEAPLEFPPGLLPGDATAVAGKETNVFAGYSLPGNDAGGVARFYLDEALGMGLQATLSLPHPVHSLALAGDMLIALGGGDLTIVELSGTRDLVERGRLENVHATRAAVSGELAYLSSWPGVLATVDLRQLDHPQFTGRSVWQFPVADGGPQGGWDVAVSGSLAVVADGALGLRILDAGSCRWGRLDPSERWGQVR